MSQVIDLNESRLLMAAKKAFRNWESQFKEAFGPETRISDLSQNTLAFLAQGRDRGTFYLYDLIMNLRGLGSGFEFETLSPNKKMLVIDQYLFMLDRIRFECMKRMKWLESYPGEDRPLVELIVYFDRLAPGLQAEIPILSPTFSAYSDYLRLSTFDKEVFIRKLIPKALEEIRLHNKK